MIDPANIRGNQNTLFMRQQTRRQLAEKQRLFRHFAVPFIRMGLVIPADTKDLLRPGYRDVIADCPADLDVVDAAHVFHGVDDLPDILGRKIAQLDHDLQKIQVRRLGKAL